VKIDVKILDLRLQAHMPSYATDGAAGIDLRACIVIPHTFVPGENKIISTGIAIHLNNPGYAAIILPRSGLGAKHGMVLGNLVGLIDSDYQGELLVSMWNRSDRPYVLYPMDRIAQLVVISVTQIGLNIVENFEPSIRGINGLGSTGRT
jgi:dUTP diphosphatase